MRAWERTDSGVEARLEEPEAAMLENLAGQLKQLHRAAAADMLDFADPAVKRLFPDAYDDPEDAAEFRRLVLPQSAQRRERSQDAVIVGLVTADRVDGQRVVRVDRSEIDDWLRAVGDMRLVLSTRVSTGAQAPDSEFSHDDLQQFAAVVDWLGFVQATLLEAL